MKVDRDKLHAIAKRLDALYDDVLELLRTPDDPPPFRCGTQHYDIDPTDPRIAELLATFREEKKGP